VYGVEVPGAEGRCGMAALVLRPATDALDLAGFARHLQAQLPPYAWPLFLRVRPELDATGTFKQLKGDLRRQAYDPAQVGEPLYVLPPRHTGYVPLTDGIHHQITSGELAF